MSKGLVAAKALIDAAICYDSSVLQNKKELTEKVLKALNSVLSLLEPGVRTNTWTFLGN